MSEIVEVAEEAVEEPQQNPIIEWAASRPYWEKYIWKKCLENGQVTDDEMEEAYKYFKMKYELVAEEDLPELSLDGLLPPEDTEMDTICLKEVKNLENVNAIPNDQSLQFGKQLTLVWGRNGSGKSGYGRVMANACFSRGKRIIHPNLKEEEVATEPASAVIVIDDGSEDGQTVQFVDNGDSIPDLKRFAAFDKESVTVQLDKSNAVQFTPGQLVVFDKVNTYMHSIEDRLSSEWDGLKKDNPVENSFAETTSVVSETLLDLSKEATDEEIKVLIAFPEKGDEQIEELKVTRDKLKKLDVPAKKKALGEQQVTLSTYKQTLERVWKLLDDENVTAINELIEEVIRKKGLVKKLGVDTFDDGIFETTGSEKWKGLLLAAKTLYEAELEATGEELESCLLCHQELTEKETQLFSNYWEFLGSSAETELKTAKGKLVAYQEALQTLRLKLPETSDEQPAIKVLLETNKPIVEEVRANIEKIGEILEGWDGKIEKHEVISNDDVPSLKLDIVDALVAAKKEEADTLKDPTENIEKLKVKIVELQHRKITSKIEEQILQYAVWLRWSEKVKAARIPKAAYTGARTEFFNQIVTENYTKIFNEECERLNSNFGLIIESHGEHGDTVIGLKLRFAEETKPTEVLSEGEQKVCALADFLTEIQLDKANCGIIFDDPVSSLDHIRKDKIAERLVEESSKRQVIVLTHDITFLLSMQHYADGSEAETLISTIRRVGHTPGITDPSLPWVAQNVSKRKKVLNAKLQDIGAMISGGAIEDAIEERVKVWYELLREAWERAVEERLFKGTVERFRPSVETNRLKRLDITNELLAEVIDAMTESSKWTHDRAAGLNVPTPDDTEMQKHLDRFSDFITNCTP